MQPYQVDMELLFQNVAQLQQKYSMNHRQSRTKSTNCNDNGELAPKDYYKKDDDNYHLEKPNEGTTTTTTTQETQTMQTKSTISMNRLR